jgi:hypothetical protein
MYVFVVDAQPRKMHFHVLYRVLSIKCLVSCILFLLKIMYLFCRRCSFKNVSHIVLPMYHVKIITYQKSHTAVDTMARKIHFQIKHQTDNLIMVCFQVQKILFRGKRSFGIVVEHNGELKKVRARKEIILSAGNIFFKLYLKIYIIFSFNYI